MRRAAITLVLMVFIALAGGSAAMANGGAGAGGNCPSPPCTKLVNPVFNATIVMDPHMAAGDTAFTSSGGVTVTQDVTTTAKMASVQIFNNFQNGVLSQAEFKILPNFQLLLGCTIDPVTSTQRFVFTSLHPAALKDWIPPAFLQALFLPVEITPSDNPVNQPVITQIVSQQCVPDPRNPGPLTNPGGGTPPTPGILVMQVVIEMLVPR